jgi:hypothetical protein
VAAIEPRGANGGAVALGRAEDEDVAHARPRIVLRRRAFSRARRAPPAGQAVASPG